ncbi:MAG: putative porin [Desulfobacterales bacterium]|nr:putative porin [Desulfobacterales bacterium]
MLKAFKRSMLVLVLLSASLVFAMPVKTYSGTLATSDFIDKLEMNGDLRIRYEWKEKDVDNEDPVDRWRNRFRLGMKFNNPEEGYKIAAGLCTGPIEATGTNATYSETTYFETGDIRLDYAYAEHKMDCFKFIGGQQKNPWETTWVFWDSDVRPVGLTGQYGFDQFFVTVGGYDVRYVDKDVAYMYAAQAGMKTEMITAALAYYGYTRVDEIIDAAAWANMDDDYGYDIIDVYVATDIKADPVKIKPYAQVFYNAGAEGDEGQSALNLTPDGASLDPEEENLGWIIGCEAKIDKFSCSLDYAQIGADSVIPGLKDADMGSELNSTDVEGFKIGLGYSITKNFGIATTAFLYQAKERDIDQDPQTYQFDLNYKF